MFLTLASAINVADIVNIGKLAWNVVTDGQQVVNYNEDYATAIPRNASWGDMYNFENYAAGPYGWRFIDFAGARTMEFSFYFTANCNGSYAGHGKFLTNVGATVSTVYSSWGFRVDVNCSPPEKPVNSGTPQDPLAGLEVFVSLQVTTALQTFVKKCLAAVLGDCRLKIIVCEGYDYL